MPLPSGMGTSLTPQQLNAATFCTVVVRHSCLESEGSKQRHKIQEPSSNQLIHALLHKSVISRKLIKMIQNKYSFIWFQFIKKKSKVITLK